MNGETVSYWNKTAVAVNYARLTEDIDTEALIIGGGISGVTCAYCLAERGVKPVLIEAGALCDGTTGNTTGKVTVQHGIVYYKISEKYGLEAARGYAQSQCGALEFVRNAIEAESIDCQFQPNTAYIYAENKTSGIRWKRNTKSLEGSGSTRSLLIKRIFRKGIWA